MPEKERQAQESTRREDEEIHERSGRFSRRTTTSGTLRSGENENESPRGPERDQKLALDPRNAHGRTETMKGAGKPS